MNNLHPLEDNVIVRMIDNEKQIGRFVIPGHAVEDATLAEVIVPNKVSYWRNGDRREPFLKAGMIVRLPKGKIGTDVPEAPEGEKWLAVPEDSIVYIRGNPK